MIKPEVGKQLKMKKQLDDARKSIIYCIKKTKKCRFNANIKMLCKIC